MLVSMRYINNFSVSIFYFNNVTLIIFSLLLQFIACPHNVANNRQVKMLADLSIVGCYNSSLSKTDRDRLMLASAKANLRKMPFFMLTEYQKVSC